MTKEEAIKHLHTYSSTNGSGLTTQDQHEEAKKMAIKALETQLRWIPCSERLPEENGQYLITVKYKHVDSYEDIYAEHGEWIDGRWDMFSFGHCGEVEDIIAWMPLPAPYSPEGEEHGET